MGADTIHQYSFVNLRPFEPSRAPLEDVVSLEAEVDNFLPWKLRGQAGHWVSSQQWSVTPTHCSHMEIV